MSRIPKPQLSSGKAQQEIDRVEAQLDAAKEAIDNLSIDKIESEAPQAEELEQQTKISKKQEREYDAPVIKPFSSEPSPGMRNPKFQEVIKRCAKKTAKAKELVRVIVENNEVIGETVEAWIGTLPGEPVTRWIVPVNMPIYIPRFVAEHLASRKYHRIKMADPESDPSMRQRLMSQVGPGRAASEPSGNYMTITETHNRISCRLASEGLE